MKISRKRIVEIIREEIGRSFQTTNNDIYSFEDFPGINVDLFPGDRGGSYYAQVTVDEDDSLSTPLRAFKTEPEARAYARRHAEDAQRALMALQK
jgi:hypothetical protein